MGKLKFKTTEAERDARAAYKTQRTKRRQHERAERYADAEQDVKLEEEEYARLVREAEDRAFRDRLFAEMGADEAQDGVHAMMEDYHVPDRWASGVHAVAGDPRYMTDDEYAEWVREGMWRRTHAKEAEDADRRRKERDERKAREKARRRETARLEREARDDAERRRRARDVARAAAAQTEYRERWKRLQTASASGDGLRLSFATVPWPVHPRAASADDLTLESVAAFVLADGPCDEKRKKQRLKDALLLWHPDRFEGRWLPVVRADFDGGDDDAERELVKHAVGTVARHLNQLMESLRDP